MNDFLRTTRIGLEVIVEGKNFLNYFLFEALVLFSVILHMYMLIIGGVWDEREIEKESIKEAAVRIANIQKMKLLKSKGQKLLETSRHMINNDIKVDPNNDIVLRDHRTRIRKRSYSMNDIFNLHEIRQDKTTIVDESLLLNEFEFSEDKWSGYEDNLVYGDTKYDSNKEFKFMKNESPNYLRPISKVRLNYIRSVSRKQYIRERKEEIDQIIDVYGNDQDDQGIGKFELNMFETTLSEYEYSKNVKTCFGQPVKPSKVDLEEFIINNKPEKSITRRIIQKLEWFLAHSPYFQSLFPSIIEQKPGVDLYVPMAIVQLITIVYLVIFYARIDPDYTDRISEDFTPATLNKITILAVFVQIAIIVLDRYLYFSRDYLSISKVEVDKSDTENKYNKEEKRVDSIAQFSKTGCIDISSSSNFGPLKTALGINIKRKTRKLSNSKDSIVRSGSNIYKESFDDDKEINTGDINLHKRRSLITIVVKYYLQLLLLIIVHAIVFWYFPIGSNISLQASPY